MNTLILGAGNAQMDVIDYCKIHHQTCHGISNNPLDPGVKYLDHYANIDILDIKAIVEYCQLHNIDVIYAHGSDIALKSAADIYNLWQKSYYVSQQQILLLTNKKLFRHFLQQSALSEINFKVVSHIAEAADWQDFPAIIKPIDNQGQRGIAIVYHKEEIPAAFANAMHFSRLKQVIIEDFFIGQEVSINSFILNGKLCYNFFSDRLTISNTGVGLVYGHKLASSIPDGIKDEIIDAIQQVLTLLEINNGPFYSQVIWNSQGFHIVEMTPRLDGCHLWKLIKYAYDVDLLSMSCELMTNGTVDYHKANTIHKPLTSSFYLNYFLNYPQQIFQLPKQGTGSDLVKHYYYQPGETVKSINGILEKTGYTISQCHLQQ